MLNSIEFKVKGFTALMMHAATLLDPMHQLSVELKKILRKHASKKTPEDLKRVKEIEWLAGIYSDAEGRPIIPGANIEAAFCQGAKSQRQKPDYEIGLTCPDNPLLIYDGPKTVNELMEDTRFRDIRRAVIPSSGSSVMRCRPIFSVWSLKFRINYLPDILHGEDIVNMLHYMGKYVGICDYTPKFGRFFVEGYAADPPLETRESMRSQSSTKSKAKTKRSDEAA